MKFLSIKFSSSAVFKVLISFWGIDTIVKFQAAAGLEMTLDHTKPPISDAKAACFLNCEENLEFTTSGHVNISRLSIYKKIPHAYSDHDSSEKGNVVATLSRDEPTLLRVSIDHKITGLLEAKRSTIQIDVFKEADCLAAYTCEVHTVDPSGIIYTGINRLRQQQIRNEGSQVTGALTSSVSLQVLSITHQLDTKLALLSQSFDQLRDKIDSVERHLDSKIWSIEQKLNNCEPRLENKVQSLEKGLESLKDQMQFNIYRPIADKLCQLENRVIKQDAKTEDVNADKQDTTYTYDIPTSDTFEKHITDMSNGLKLLVNSFNQLQLLEKQNSNSLQVLLTGMVNISNSFKSFDETVTNISNLNLQDLSTDIFSMVTKHYSNTTERSLQSHMSDLFFPKTCQKGMSPVLYYPVYPYAVVFPDKETTAGLDVPYLCDTVTEGGGWIVIQRRSLGDVDFYRSWGTYKEGFGSKAGDFWLGNENIHRLTSKRAYELRIEMKYKGRLAYANYDTFSLGNEQSKYTLRVGQYRGTAGDSLEIHNGEPFSTYDRDHDLYDRNCAEVFSGAWWYKACHHSNLNGKWQSPVYKGPNWQTLSDGDPVLFSEMKIRRK